jgi:hypothetical protein
MVTKFQPELMEVEFNFSAMASVVSPIVNSLEVTGHFRSFSDYIGLLFNSEDYRMHDRAKYPTSKNYAGVSLSFSPVFQGSVARFNDLAQLPALAVYYTDGTEKVVTLGFLSDRASTTDSYGSWSGEVALSHKWIAWDSETVYWEKWVVVGYEDVFDSEGNYLYTREITELHTGYGSRESDYVLDYANGRIAPVAGSGIPYGADIWVTYEYGLHQTYTIDFDNLKEGTHPNNSTNITSSNIEKVVFPIIPSYYQQGRNQLTGNSDEVVVTFNDWSVVGGDIGSFPTAKIAHPFRLAEGYDDEYYRNPYRLVQSMYHLGYRKVINLYVGASHYYDKLGPAGASSIDHKNQTLITNIGVCTAAKKWFRYLLKAMKEFDFEDIIVSMSMENLQMPESWKQRIHNGEAGQTGWEPPTSFFSPTNTEARNYWEKVVRDYLDIVVEEGFTPILQLGEPWWWWQEFQPGDINQPYPGKPPCFYDNATKNLYEFEKGKSLPVFTSSDIYLNAENIEALKWLRDKLGDFSHFAKSIVKSYPGGKYTILFFPPSVLDEQRVPETMRIVNYPSDYWKIGNLDFIQIEDYDWVVHDNENHPDIFDFARNPNLKYQPHLTHYFAGFAWEQFLLPINVQWEQIEKAAIKGLSVGMKEVFVWAGTQIRRDSWNPKIPIKYIPAVINRTLVHIEETK